MSNMKMVAIMENMMEQSVEEAVRTTVRTMWKEKTHDETDEFVHEVLMALGLRVGIILGAKLPFRRTQAPPPAAVDDGDDDDDDYALIPALEKAPVSAPASVASDSESSGKDRKRTVSKKMKDTFLAMEGGTEESLKSAMKVYKAASEDQLATWGGKWESFARAFLAGECTPVKSSPAPKAKAAKKAAKAPADPDAPAPKKAAKAPKEARNFTWTPTAKKLFTETVEGGGSAVSDMLKDQFAAHVNAMSAEDFKVLAVVGHMRAFVASKSPVASESAAASAVAAAPAPAPAPAEDNFDDEDLEVIEVDGEELTIGVKSGFIFRATEDSGDVKIGVAGEGKFKDVKIPSA